MPMRLIGFYCSFFAMDPARFFRSWESSGAGKENCAAPQSKHTMTLGNTHTIGSSTSLDP
jgi:hypothetical protein